MAFSRRELILQAVVAALDAGGKPAGLTVGRSPRTAAEVSKLPRLDVLLTAGREQLGERVEPSTFGDRVGRSMLVAVVARYKGTNGGPPLDQVGDPLTTWVVQALEATYDEASHTYLGGLATDLVEEGTEWAQDESAANVPLGNAGVLFRIEYETRRSDPTSAPQE